MTFGLTVTLVVLVVSLVTFGSAGTNWLMLFLALFLSATAFSGLGAFVSVAVREVFEAQTLANFIRFPMMFLGGVFVPLALMPTWLQIIARLLPLTYSVEALRAALSGGSWATAAIDLGTLAAFSLIFFSLAVITLKRRIE
jgi:ABC-2 type transport system permease protein